MFNFIGIYIFVPGCGCVGRDPVYYYDRGPIMLLRRLWFRIIVLSVIYDLLTLWYLQTFPQ